MNNNRLTSWPKKIGLVVFGIVLTFVLLEIFLRLGGFLFLRLQENKNQFSLKRGGEVRILCLGESTTALGGDNSYPRQLETILNSSQSPHKFTVINKGIPATTTTQIVTRIKEYLDTYQPQIAVAMMGINDPAGALFDAKNARSNPLTNFAKDLRIYKLFKLLVAHLRHRATDKALKKLDAKLAQIEAQIAAHPNSFDYTKLAGFYRAERKWDQERATLVKALALNPRNYEALAALATNYQRGGDYGRALPLFQMMIKATPPQSEAQALAYNRLAETYQLNGQSEEAVAVYQSAIQNFTSRDIGSYGGLAEIYLDSGKTKEALALLEKQIQISPGGTGAYIKLAHCYRTTGQIDKAQALLQEAIRRSPSSAVLYNELGAILVENKKFTEAQIMLEKSLTLSREDFEGDSKGIYTNLAAAYEALGKKDEAAKLRGYLKNISSDYSGETYGNYQKVRKALSDRGVRMVVAQYPIRSLAPLKAMLEPSGDIVFVDNEKIFKEAVSQRSYDYYFTDRFSGDFGHCTPAGNHLLAQNIANAILKIAPNQ